ncbi:MAG TPA: hypothetical protein VMT15_05940 [Bryobacteraceae bacterium]|nr:hypothetical protein [Bryobacteraceae bacterium]
MGGSLQSLVILLVLCAAALGQSVSVKDGNVFLKARDGGTIQITSSGLDSDPSLSLNQKLVVFVRRTPEAKIATGAGLLDTNELWIAETVAGSEAHRILAGHQEAFDSKKPSLAGFTSPRFSTDGRNVYFLAQIAATSQHLFLLDLKSQQVRFLCRALSVEVLQTGEYAGFLIVLKDLPRVMPGRFVRYWLVKSNGEDVGDIGEESDLREFRRMFNSKSSAG